MSSHDIKARMRRIPEEIFNTRNLALVDELVAPGFVDHVPVPRGFPAGVEGLRQFVTQIRAAFPDFQYMVDDVVVEGDRLAMRVTASGTHRGTLFGLRPTGRQARWTEMHFARVANGKLTEHWANIDQLGMLQQLGAIPTQPQPEETTYQQPPQA